MNHGDHGGHDMPMPMGPKCTMNMLWNTQIIDTCVVFRSWHISSNMSFVLSCFVILGLGVLYEYLRVFSNNVDRRIAASLTPALSKGKGRASSNSRGSGRSTPDRDDEEVGLLGGSNRRLLSASYAGTPVPMLLRVLRAGLYGSTVFLSFFLMLVFMTYNAYLIVAIVAGAAIGHYIFGSHMDVDLVLAGGAGDKGMACH